MSTGLIPNLPTSPIKPNILQPNVNYGFSPTSNVKNASILTNVNVGLLKPVQVQTASADSTENNHSNVKGSQKPGRGRKRKQKASKEDHNVMNNTLPFVKHHHSVKKPQTPSVSRRNARERNRVKQVNNGFCTLRNHIPHLKNKTSKVDTLRAAVDYIQTLRKLVGEDLSNDNHFDVGSVLISDVQEQEELLRKDKTRNLCDDSSHSSNSPPPRSMSALSGDNINPMVYQLPPVNLTEFTLQQEGNEVDVKQDNVVDASHCIDDDEDEGLGSLREDRSSPIDTKEHLQNESYWWSQGQQTSDLRNW